MRAPAYTAHLKAILALPFMVLLIIPGVILWLTYPQVLIMPLLTYRIYSLVLGLLFLVGGLTLFVQTLRLFHQRGKGTLAPWQPPQRLVIEGPYRFVRNPMIVAVNAILLAEALLIPSGYILIWQFLFFTINHLYFVYREEPDLERRFGKDYQQYKKEVPRWIPRWKIWR